MCYKDEVQKKNGEKFNRIMDSDNVPTFIRIYFINLTSEASKINYWVAIKDFLNWAINKRIIEKDEISSIKPDDMASIISEHVTMYLKEKEQSGMSPTTLRTRKNNLSSFWEYLYETDNIPVTKNIVRRVKYKGADPSNVIERTPSDEDLEKMMENICKKNDAFVRERNKSVLRVLKGTGLRESELAGLDLDNVYLMGSREDKRPHIKVLGKGKYYQTEMRKVLITGDAVEAFQEWFKIRVKVKDIKDKDAVFLNKNGKRLTEENIKRIFRQYGGGVTPHMIRHWYASVMGQKYGVEFAMQQLGHESATTTRKTYIDGTYGIDLSNA